MELSVKLKMTLNFWSLGLNLPSDWTTGLCHHNWFEQGLRSNEGAPCMVGNPCATCTTPSDLRSWCFCHLCMSTTSPGKCNVPDLIKVKDVDSIFLLYVLLAIPFRLSSIYFMYLWKRKYNLWWLILPVNWAMQCCNICSNILDPCVWGVPGWD